METVFFEFVFSLFSEVVDEIPSIAAALHLFLIIN
jgi:hypothetical protein